MTLAKCALPTRASVNSSQCTTWRFLHSALAPVIASAAIKARTGAMAKRSKGTVGIVGLGNMGGAFARHLAAAGWRVLGFDIDAARTRAATRAGVEIAQVETLAAVAPVI